MVPRIQPGGVVPPRSSVKEQFHGVMAGLSDRCTGGVAGISLTTCKERSGKMRKA